MDPILKNTIDRLLKTRERVIVAIDGPCAAGKTTLAARLREEYDCNVFHMDDFFLRPQQRTPQRLAEAGGNVDYERFWEEVILPLTAGEAVIFRPFDCGSQTLREPVTVVPKRLTIIEGTYSHHPFFGPYAHLRLFLPVSGELQRQRILRRPVFLHERFFRQWIPMENAYFEAFSIREGSSLILEEQK